MSSKLNRSSPTRGIVVGTMMRGSLALILVLGIGCSDGPGPEPITPSEAEDLCTKSCAYDVTCQADELAVCVEDCVTDLGTWSRHDADATVSECRAGLSCDEDTAVCLEKVKPLAYHHKFEDACRAGLDGCPTVDVDLDCAVEFNPDSDDVGFFRFMAEPVIDELIACFDGADCDARLACMDAVYVEHGINL